MLLVDFLLLKSSSCMMKAFLEIMSYGRVMGQLDIKVIYVASWLYIASFSLAISFCMEVLQHAGKDHTLLLVLRSGIFHYCFIVDGEARKSPVHTFVSDEMGSVCHVLDVNDYVPETLDSISEFETPGSPDSSYNQDLPEEDDFSREPVVVPQQLHLTVLDMSEAEEGSSSRPQHVVLNHLFLEKGRAAQSVVALGLTHRLESKYVTVVLYKPVQR